MTTDQTVDTVLAIISLGLLAMGLGSLALGWIVRTWDKVVARYSYLQADEPEPPRSIVSPRVNAVEPDEPPFANAFVLELNAEEIAAVQRMIEHKITAVKPSKSSTIQAGFGIARGGSSAYIRASLIYDRLFGPPEPAVKYRPLTEEQQRTREALGLPSK